MIPVLLTGLAAFFLIRAFQPSPKPRLNVLEVNRTLRWRP